MTLFSFRTLAWAWTALAGAAIVGAGALEASYVPPLPVIAMPDPAASVSAAPPPVMQPAVPFQNRSLVALLPPHPAAVPAAPLPVPPIPPVRAAHVEPRRAAPGRAYAAEPAYDTGPFYPGWDWDRRLPYPGQYASGQAPLGGQPYAYGWPPQY